MIEKPQQQAANEENSPELCDEHSTVSSAMYYKLSSVRGAILAGDGDGGSGNITPSRDRLLTS